MSDETWEGVEQAIKKHIADEHNGAYLTQWVVVAHAVSAKDPAYSYYKYLAHEGPRHEAVGLLSLGLERLRYENAQNEDPED